MDQQIHWYARTEEGSQVTFRRRVQRVLQIAGHPRDAWLVVRILFWAFLLPLLKQLIPLKRLAPFMWVSPGISQDQEMDQKVATVVRWIYIFIFPNEKSCLDRSLLLYRFLSRNNKDPRLITGMRRAPDQNWKGHAWIEVNGVPFEEAVHHIKDYRAFLVFGPEGVMRQVPPDPSETTPRA